MFCALDSSMMPVEASYDHSSVVRHWLLETGWIFVRPGEHGCPGKRGYLPPLENAKARFASITALWFARKGSKSLPTNTFHGLKIHANAFAAVAVPGPHSPRPWRWILGAAWRRWLDGRWEGKVWKKRVKEAELRKWETGGLVFAPLQKLLRAAMPARYVVDHASTTFLTIVTVP